MRRLLLASLLAASVFAAAPPTSPPPLLNSRPLSPADELATFALPDGFRAELVAAEPDIVDPVSMCFDERGRLFVCEMRGYPNGGRGTGTISTGRIRMLEDRNGDGLYETSTLWAEDLRFPTGVAPHRGGLLVANAPDLLYLKDTKDAGKADLRRTLYTGFDTANIQSMLNTIQFALDNRFHACAGLSGGNVTCPDKPTSPAAVLRGRGISFDPDIPGSLSPTSGGGQYGLSADEFGHWFTATNSQHLRHIVLPDEYLRRNPSLAVRATTLDIPEHGAACRVFRKSPFEAWRLERTTRRAGSVDASRFPPTELFPGGYATSACSPVVYTGNLFPKTYHGSAFICDPANNSILRDTLTPNGATFVARRGEKDREFLTSTDNWFRPVHQTIGPDGALYVLDFYREVIETPLSLPPDILARVNVTSRGRGRVWRITTAPAGTKVPAPNLHKATTADLVANLAHANSWHRLTAQRLLVERGDKSASAAMEKIALTSDFAPGRAHALWAMEGLGLLRDVHVAAALNDAAPGVREQALRLCEPRFAKSPALVKAAAERADDPSPMVRFRLALSLGFAKSPDALAALASRPDNDGWTQTAILCSAGGDAVALLRSLSAKASPAFLRKLASLAGTQGTDAGLAAVLSMLETTASPADLLDGLGEGLSLGSRSLESLWSKPSAALAPHVTKAKVYFTRAAAESLDAKRSVASRIAAVSLLGRGPFETFAPGAAELLAPRTPPEVQLATIRALSARSRPEVAPLLLAAWPSAGPSARREIAEAMLAGKDRVAALLDAVAAGKVLPSQLEPARLAQLRKVADPALRARAAKLLGSASVTARDKVVKAYEGVLDLKADPAAGKKVFAKNCATCHVLEKVGVQVGAELLSALRNKTGPQLLIDVLDPSREVDPRFVAYTVTTKRGRTHTGIISAETAASLTLKRGEGAEDTVLRAQLDTVESTGKSLMPEGLEAQMTRQELADLIAYLLRVTR